MVMGVLVEQVKGKKFIELISPAIYDLLKEEELKIMENAVEKSTSVCMVSKGQMIGITGIAPDTLLSSSAFLWLYTNPFNERISVEVLKATRVVIKNFLVDYPCLVGYCEVENVKAQRWISWLGADFGRENGKLIPFKFEV